MSSQSGCKVAIFTVNYSPNSKLSSKFWSSSS